MKEQSYFKLRRILITEQLKTSLNELFTPKLHHIGYGHRRLVRKLLLLALKKNRYLQFSKKHEDWSVDDWESVK
ncbi:hypothetical protein TNCV_5120401 [Trichonephila clavipes]|nr:hypothetical protein TNCV_5120401 [Trichonephila clavipes]